MENIGTIEIPEAGQKYDESNPVVPSAAVSSLQHLNDAEPQKILLLKRKISQTDDNDAKRPAVEHSSSQPSEQCLAVPESFSAVSEVREMELPRSMATNNSTAVENAPKQSLDEVVRKFLEEEEASHSREENLHPAEEISSNCLPPSLGSSVQEGDKPSENLPKDANSKSSLEDDSLIKQYEELWNNDFTNSPLLLSSLSLTSTSKKSECFFKGCKWSPDGTCLLTCSDDKCLRVINLPEEICALKLHSVPEPQIALKVKEAETIYDYCWLPQMTSMAPETCCFLSTSRDAPVHLWDAYTGELKASYKYYNHVDEMVSVYSLALNPKGSKLYCGLNKGVAIFDINRPGRDFTVRSTKSKSSGKGKPRVASPAQSGIISCLAVNPVTPTIYAAGSYTRTVGVYSEPNGKLVMLLEGQQGGVTHISFSSDGNLLYSGGRKDQEILCWDLRNMGSVLFVLERKVNTNQRIYFDAESSGQFVLSGNADGTVRIWDVSSVSGKETGDDDDDDEEPTVDPVLTFKAGKDCINGVSLHPTMPVIATSSGQRHFYTICDGGSCDSEEEEEMRPSSENNVKLWWCGKPPEEENPETTQ